MSTIMETNLALRTFENIHSLLHLYRSQLHNAMKLMHKDLSHMECKALAYFAHNGGASQTDLVAFMQRDKAQLNRIIKILKEQGLLSEVKDPKDKRRSCLYVTEEGQSVYQTLSATRQQICDNLIVGLTVEELDTLDVLMNKLKTNLEKDHAS